MPVYDYRCNVCSSSIEFKREFGEDREPSCCKQTMQRQWTSPGVLFNGSGFYSTDNRKQRYTMNTMIAQEVVSKEWILSAIDRCDSCAAEALVKVTGISGDLMFCGHHYNKIIDNAEGYKKMMSFMISIIDERDKLIEDKAKGKDY